MCRVQGSKYDDARLGNSWMIRSDNQYLIRKGMYSNRLGVRQRIILFTVNSIEYAFDY